MRKLMTSIEKSSPLMLQRFELKFLIPSQLIKPIQDYAETYCVADPYADENGWYTINTLYLDSPKNTFLRRRMNGDDTRYNMRLRSYGDNPIPPYFAEIKYKQNGVVKKFRTKLTQEDWDNDFARNDGVLFGPELLNDSENYLHFQRLAIVHNVEPKVFTQYRRKALMSVVDDYARITFDNDLSCHPTEKFILSPDDNMLSHYDNSTLFPDGTDTILELKCTTSVPLWMMDLIKYFDLSRSRFSKFANSFFEIQSRLNYQNDIRQVL